MPDPLSVPDLLSVPDSLGELLGPFPSGPEFRVDLAPLWERWSWLRDLDACPRDAVYYGEGSVGEHTRRVVRALAGDRAWRALPALPRAELYAAALLSDLGKPLTTRAIDPGESLGAGSRYSARGHPRVGAGLARILLWEAGAPFASRERICALIEQHLVPFQAPDLQAPERRLRRIALSADLGHLAILARADAEGRGRELGSELLAAVELFTELSRELEGRGGISPFPDGWTRFRYFRDASRAPGAAVHDDSRAEVVVMAGLPGAGKSTWVQRTCPELPRISLDELRDQLGISPEANQGVVVAAARERARVYLRAGLPFVWDATNLSRDHRRQLVDLCEDYRARVRLVYLEASRAVTHRQNRERPRSVPPRAIERMLRRWEVPDLAEASQVDYLVSSG